MVEETDNNEILTDIIGGLGVITLNRPKALNALTHNMMKRISGQLAAWEDDDRVKAVLFRGAGDKAFCAGGDIKAVYMARKNGDTGFDIAQYFFDEYSMNRQLFHYPKPLIAFMDGITMGGGYGIAGPCDFKIATGKTVFAMPEVGIGFFPDIGGVYHLLGCRENIAAYLCLSGNSIAYADTLWCGITTHVTATDDEEALIAKLAMTSGDNGDIDFMIREFQRHDIDEPLLAQKEAIIDDCFSYDNLGDITKCLESRDRELFDTMNTRSPLSLAVTMRHLNEAKDMDFDAVIARDYQICQHFMEGQDFFEGVRAAVIDKDKNPQWQHGSIEDVRAVEVNLYFSPAKRTLY